MKQITLASALALIILAPAVSVSAQDIGPGDTPLNIILTANSNDLDALKTMYLDFATTVEVEEPGMQNYEMYIAEDGKVTFLDFYENSDAFLAHLQLFGSVAEAMLANFQFTSINVYGHPSADVVEAVSGFKVTWNSYSGGFRRY